MLATLDLDQTVFEAFSHGLVGTEPELRARLHRYGLFADDEAHQPVGTLSLGQWRKLQIARLVATEPTLLILDEPTNHLDLPSVEQFEAALCEFRGTCWRSRTMRPSPSMCPPDGGGWWREG